MNIRKVGGIWFVRAMRLRVSFCLARTQITDRVEQALPEWAQELVFIAGASIYAYLIFSLVQR